jgi:ABC-type branched-subunit amino acid transport system ATPase component
MRYAPDGITGIFRSIKNQLTKSKSEKELSKDGRFSTLQRSCRSETTVTIGEAQEELSNVVLSIEDIWKDFGGVPVLRGVTLELDDRESRGVPVLLGANGAGKSVLFDIITGVTKATSGKICIPTGNGGQTRIDKMRTWERARLGVSAMTQRPSVFTDLTVGENLLAAATAQCSFSRRFKPLANFRDERERADRFVEWLGLHDYGQRRAGELSYGLRRILQFGMCVIWQPNVLLLDEPTSGLNAGAAEWMGRLMLDVSSNTKDAPTSRRISMFVIEHDIGWIRDFASTIHVLNDGRLIKGIEGQSVEESLADRRVQSSFIGQVE